jgi:hypothetical protein
MAAQFRHWKKSHFDCWIAANYALAGRYVKRLRGRSSFQAMRPERKG